MALPKPPTPPSLADPPRVRNLLTRMSSVIGWPLLLTAIWVFAPFRSMVTSIRLEPQSMLFWQISRDPAPPPVSVISLGFREELSADFEACHRSRSCVCVPIIPLLNYTSYEHLCQVVDDKTLLVRSRLWRDGTVLILDVYAQVGQSSVSPNRRANLPWKQPCPGRVVMFGKAFDDCWYKVPGAPGLELSGDLRFRGPQGLRKLRVDCNGRPYILATKGRWPRSNGSTEKGG